jgi:hypothetical protein
MYRPVTLETWVSGPARVIAAAMRGDGWYAAILDHHADQVRADLSASGAPVDRATLTLYLHVLSQAMDYVTTDVPDEALLLPGARHRPGLVHHPHRRRLPARHRRRTHLLTGRPAGIDAGGRCRRTGPSRDDREARDLAAPYCDRAWSKICSG